MQGCGTLLPASKPPADITIFPVRSAATPRDWLPLEHARTLMACVQDGYGSSHSKGVNAWE